MGGVRLCGTDHARCGARAARGQGQRQRAQLLAGGTDMLVQLRAIDPEPRAIVDVKKIPETGEIRLDESGLVLGAAVTAATLTRHEGIGALLARARRGRRPHRFHPDPGARLARRQPLHGVAGGRQHPDHDRQRRRRRRRRPPVGAPAVEQFVVGVQRNCHSRARSSRAPRWTSPWSAPASRHPRRRRHAAPRASRSAPSRRRRCWSRRGRRGPGRHRPVDDAALAALAARVLAACRPIDDKRGTVELPAARSRACWPNAPRRIARANEARKERWPDPRHHHVNGDAHEFLCEPQQTLLDVLRDELRPDRHQGRLRHRRLRRLQRHARRPPGLRLPGAGRRGRGPRGRDHRGHGRRRDPAPAAAASSSSTPRCSAASARRASWSRPRRCSRRTRTRPRPRSATGWPATCAAAPATTRSSAPCSTPPPR